MFKNLRWLIVGLLFIGGAISYLDRAALSVAAPLIAKDLALDPAQLGIVFSSFFFGYAAFCAIGGYAADRAGPRKVFGVAMTVWSVFCGMTAAATGLFSLIVFRVVFGMGEGPFCSTASKFVSNWFPRSEQASAVGMANAGQSLGAAIAGPVVGYLAVVAGWRISFIAIAALGIAWVIAWLWIATDRPNQHRWLRREANVHEEAEALAKTKAHEPAPPVSSYLKSPVTWATAFAFFGYSYILYFFLSWFPSYLTTEHHLSIGKMGMVSAIPWIAGFIGQSTGGFLSDRIYAATGNALLARKLVLGMGLTVAAVCVALAGNRSIGITGIVALTSTAIFFMYLTTNTYFAIILDTVDESRVGAVTGVVHLVANLAGIVAPALTGFLVQWSGHFSSAFGLTGAIAIAGVIVVAVFVKDENRQQAQTDIASAHGAPVTKSNHS